MNNQNKAISIILYIVWPLSALFIGIKNFNSKFGRNLLIAAFVYLGYTANDFGDLERYASYYYESSGNKLNNLFELFTSLNLAKFFTDSTAIILSVFDNHHVYFAFLFGFYAYFLINAINLIRISIIKSSNLPVLISFITFALFYSVTTIYNYAFYTGAIYFLYFLLQIILKGKKKKYYLFILFTPLFHYALVPLLILPIVLLLFGRRTKYYVLLLILFTTLSQSFLIDNIGNYLSNSETVFSNRFDTYGSSEGKERMDDRYQHQYESSNINYKILKNSRDVANNIAVPLLLLVLFINKTKFKKNNTLLDVFHLGIASLALTNLMINISQGSRYFYISGFLILATYTYYVQQSGYKDLKFKYLLYILIPFILLSNFVILVLAKELFSSEAILSNFPYLLFKSL